MLVFISVLLCSLALVAAQQAGTLVNETHPRLQWTRCAANEGCQAVDGEVVMDANKRWIHKIDSYENCYSGNDWDDSVCDTGEDCTSMCVLEGAEYIPVYGVNATNDSISLKLKTYIEFARNIGSRLFLMESKNRYQMFTLLNNELAFDVDLSTVECGINSALYFVAMDADGGQARFPTNKAGAEYGTGYCDADCPRDLKFVGGKANMDPGWAPSQTDPDSGDGYFGACCPGFAVWNSNAHSFSMSSHTCPQEDYQICEWYICDGTSFGPDVFGPRCDRMGCDYNPYRMGNKDFYGKGKEVDTARKFTVVTQWTEDKVTQFFIQDGRKIDIPAPTWDGLPNHSGLTAELCEALPVVFGDDDLFVQNGGWKRHTSMLNQPMVLVMSIGLDHYAHNLWLDSLYPPYDNDENSPGKERGDCLPIEDNDPLVVENKHPNAKVVWSNIRFGPIGSTVKV
ncbi:hypothetical protein MFIFM68171_07654 [Madurella fahalii]|uniref:Glucanase n=1 Tax=Madurella fahalii TaxID=1157608 RepID=A0ABQ0GIE0_9PEZI